MSANMWTVVVVGRDTRRCKSIDQAVSHAKKYVYLGTEDEKRVRGLLNSCQVASYSYGFSEVHITPEHDPTRV